MTYKDYLNTLKSELDRIKKSKKKSIEQYYIFDKDLGWKLNKNSKHNSLPYSTDSKGNRKTTNNNKKQNIAIIGDSMVHGDEVSDKETWGYFLAKKIKKKFNLINLGVSGYGNDQAFLKFKKCIRKEKIKIAVFCFNSGNELRNINIQRLFLNNKGSFVYLKPIYKIKNNKILLLKPPKNKEKDYYSYLKNKKIKNYLKNHDFFYPNFFKEIIRCFLRIFNFRSNYNYFFLFNKKKSLQITLEIFKLFVSLCKKKGIIPIILFLPKLKGIFKSEENLIYLQNETHNLKMKNFYPKDFFLKNNNLVKNYFCKKNHYSKIGGEILAESVYNFIKKNNYY